jgi:hypothetical protein
LSFERLPPRELCGCLQIEGLFHIWNDALATGDPKIVTALYSSKATLLPTRSNKVCPSLLHWYSQPHTRSRWVVIYLDTHNIPQGIMCEHVSVQGRSLSLAEASFFSHRCGVKLSATSSMSASPFTFMHQCRGNLQHCKHTTHRSKAASSRTSRQHGSGVHMTTNHINSLLKSCRLARAVHSAMMQTTSC